MYHNRHTRLIALLVFLVQLSQYSSPILPAYIFIISSRVCVRLVCVCLVYFCLTNFLSNSFKCSEHIFRRRISPSFKNGIIRLEAGVSNFYAIGFLWRRCNFRGKCRARYCDVAKTTCGIRQSNYLPLLLYRIPLSVVVNVSILLTIGILLDDTRLYDKNSESDYFFSSTKIRIFFQQNWESEYF